MLSSPIYLRWPRLRALSSMSLLSVSMSGCSSCNDVTTSSVAISSPRQVARISLQDKRCVPSQVEFSPIFSSLHLSMRYVHAQLLDKRFHEPACLQVAGVCLECTCACPCIYTPTAGKYTPITKCQFVIGTNTLGEVQKYIKANVFIDKLSHDYFPCT